MARVKEKALTLEERLEQALVPVEEHAYEVPENWCWVRFGYVASTQYGYTTKAVDCADGPKILRITDIQDGGVNWKTVPHCVISESDYEKYVLKDDDIVIARIGATTGKSFLLHNPKNSVFASYLIRVRISDPLLPQYVYLFLQSDTYWAQISELSSGIALPGVNSSKLQTLMFPIAPCSEQHRIVERIDRLFAELNEAKEKAQAVIDGYEDRRASILHRAFTGELTEEWRELNNIPDTSWQTKSFDDVAEVKSNLVDPAGYMDFPHIAPDNIEKKTGILLDYHTVAEDGVKSGKHLFFAGQILYSKIRPYLSKVVIVDFDGLCSADMYPVEPKEGINTRFLWYYMLSDDFLEQASTAGSRSVLPKINQKELGRIQIRVTDLTEQHEIVRILDSLLSKESAAKSAAERAISQIDTMKKSILARAFRGELGTNDPEDEPAIKLLKRTLAAK